MDSSKDINDLHPTLKPLCQTWLNECKSQNIDIRIIYTWRSPRYQDALFAKGRALPGKKVTNLTGAKSKHCFTIDDKPASKAFDFGVFDKGVYVTDGDNIAYKLAGELGEGLGLSWGGRWKSPFDPGHLELK